MDMFFIITLAALESVALYLAVRLWFGHRMRVLPRIFWSLFLLIPLLGLLMYGFVLNDMGKNPDNAGMPSDSDAFFGGGSSGYL